MQTIPWLSILLFLPLVCGVLTLLLGRSNRAAAGLVALFGALATLIVGVMVYLSFDPLQVGFQLVEDFSWIPAVGARYTVGVDGVNVGLVLLTTLLTTLLVSYLLPRLGEDAHTHLFTILALETALIGVLVSVDVLLFYVFWEAMLIPMYFLIAVWGGENRSAASLKFIVMMMIGSLLMLIGVLWMYWWSHSQAPGTPFSFNLTQWITRANGPGGHIPHWIQMWMFFFFFISFAIKLPLFPLHSWLPDAQAEGSLAFNVLLIEVGAYGFIRFCLPLFPDASATWAPALAALAVINIVYGAVLAIVQVDLKRLFAYASLSHAGFILLGLYSMTVQGIEGGILYMINSGLTTAALYFIADVLFRRRRSRRVDAFGGAAQTMPFLYFGFMVVALGAIGLPGLNGFTSEFLVLLGAIRSNMISPWFGYAAGAGVVLSSVYMLWMFQRVMYGPPPAEPIGPDLDSTEQATLWPLVAVVFFIGLGSVTFTRPMHKTVQVTIESIRQGLVGSEQAPPGPDLPTDQRPRVPVGGLNV